MPEKKPPPPSVNIADIARAAGVHPASVSRALRGNDKKVSSETRARIEQIAREMGYRPNAVAASLRTRQTNLVGVVVPDLGNPLFGPLVTRVEVELRKAGYLCLVAHTSEDPGERKQLADALSRQQVSGLLMLAAEVDDPMLTAVERYGIPTVLVNRALAGRKFSSVINDDRASVQLVVAHLKELGHKRIAHLAGPESSSTGHARRTEFEAQCAAAGLKAEVVEARAFTREAGHEATQRLLQKKLRATAVFAANDLIALGALDAFRQHGLRVPEDVSLVGHNDMPLVDLVAPPLTTVRVDVEQMARRAAMLLLDAMQQAEQGPVTLLLTPSLVVRASTARA